MCLTYCCFCWCVAVEFKLADGESRGMILGKDDDVTG